MKEKPNYYAIIPAHVRYSNITDGAKLLYGEITALSSAEGYCWASNSHFAKLYDRSENTISRWINSLKEIEAVTVQMVYKEKSKQIEKRIIKIADRSPQKWGEGIPKNGEKGTLKNGEESITSKSNITSINNIKEIYKEKSDLHFGEFDNVILNNDEIKKLKSRLVNYTEYIERLSSYLASSGKKYKSHYAVILTWARKAGDLDNGSDKGFVERI